MVDKTIIQSVQTKHSRFSINLNDRGPKEDLTVIEEMEGEIAILKQERDEWKFKSEQYAVQLLKFKEQRDRLIGIISGWTK